MINMPAPILVTGCARSGTSMVAGAINLCGAFGGEMSGPNRNNPKGMFENAKIRNTIVKPYLSRSKVDPMGQFPLPDVQKLSIPNDWASKVKQIFLEQGYQRGPWMYKGAKMCLMWPVWHHAFPEAKWIIVRRKDDDIINSCLKTNFMRAFNNNGIQRAINVNTIAEGWQWWVNEHKKRFVEMINKGLNIKIVWPEKMVLADYQQIYETIEWLGLKWNPEILSFIDSKLWKSRRK